MLPAEKTHYRKGLALGMTLAETFSVIVFILLLACALLLRTATASRDEAQVNLAIATEMLHGGDTSYINTDAWRKEVLRLRMELEVVRTQLEQVKEERLRADARAQKARLLLAPAGVDPEGVAQELLERSAELAIVRDSLKHAETQLQSQGAQRDSLKEAATNAERLRQAVGAAVAERDASLAPSQVDSVVAQAARAEQLAQELTDARDAIGSLAARLRDAERLISSDSVVDSMRTEVVRSGIERDSLQIERDSLQTVLAGAEQERDDAMDRAEYREEELRRQGTGIDPPPCWLDADGKPEYIFRVELTDDGMILRKIVPAHRDDDEALEYAQGIEDGREYAPNRFLELTRPIYEAGRRRTVAFGPTGCRFWVRPVDRTGASKAVFRARTDQLGQRFWFHW